MKATARYTIAGGVGLAVAALVAAPAYATPAPATHAGHQGRHGQATPVFVQTNNVGGNAIVVYHRASDGTLTQAGTYPTGGLGGMLAGSVVDHLASQGSLTYDRAHRLLYAVNAGSNTITVFRVHSSRLQRIAILGSGGDFPVSVTSRGELVYVLNARNGGAIQGFRWRDHRLVRVARWNRPLGLDPTETPEFTSTPGQIAFTPGGSKLVVTTKNNKNQIDVFNLNRRGGPAGAPVVTPDPGNVPFAVTFDPAGRLQVAESGPNAVATYRLHRDGRLTLVARTTTGQQATCWITRSGRLIFADNAGSATVSGFAVVRGGLVATGTTSTDAGTVDAAASSDGKDLYVQTGAAGIVDEFSIGRGGALTEIGKVLVPDAVGGEGIAAS